MSLKSPVPPPYRSELINSEKLAAGPWRDFFEYIYQHMKTVWTKYTADSVTLSAGTSTDVVADLQSFADGNFYEINEVAATPGQILIVSFTGVDALNYVNCVAAYNGSSSHAIAIQLYNWTTSIYDTFGALENAYYTIATPGQYVLTNHDFWVLDDTNYIGTGDNKGKVNVRFIHPMLGVAAPQHKSVFDVVSLYRFK